MRKTTQERFVAKVIKSEETGCHLFKPDDKTTYAGFWFEGKMVGAHVAAYRMYVGEIPEGHQIRHKCDVPRCVNPEHLETGTIRQNADDRITRGRGNSGSR